MFLSAGIKFPPIEEGWEHKGHSFNEAAAHVAKGGNVGVIAINGYIGLDQDDPEAFVGLDLPTTTTWETRPGRLGMRFRCDDRTPEVLAKFGFKPDKAQIYLYDPRQIVGKDGKGNDLFKAIGEIKLERTYQVIPPSWKTLKPEEGGQRVDYKMLVESTPAEISLHWLLSELQRIGLSFKKIAYNKPVTASIGPENAAQRVNKGKTEVYRQRERRYAEAALADEVRTLASTPKGHRNDQLNRSAFALGQFVASGVLNESEVIRALENVAEDDEPEKILPTIRSGLEAGSRHPREFPEPKENVLQSRPEAESLNKARLRIGDLDSFRKAITERPSKVYDKEILEALAVIQKEDLGGWEDLKKAMRGAKITVRSVEKKIKELPEKKPESRNYIKEINKRIPGWIEENHFKTVAETEKLYHYEHGVYLGNGEQVLKTLIEAEFGDATHEGLVRDVVGKVKRRTYIDQNCFNSEHVLNVKNGLIDLDTLELRPHTPDCLTTAQLNVVYDPKADALRVKKFLQEVAQPEDVILIEEILGWLLWPDYNVHKAVMLLGQGRNGKGTLLRLITAFLGKESVSNVTLQDLTTDRFSKADLHGKLANIGGDLPAKDLSDTAAFRNLTGGDDVRAQEKYRAAFSFRNKAKLLFSANVLPRSPDDTYAFYSRWILIEFLHVFDQQKGTADPDLDSKLQTSEELSGLLNIALAGLARLRANGWRFSYNKSVEDVELMYKRNANPVLAFLMDECEADTESHIEKQEFFNKFTEYAKKHGLRPLSMTKFGELLKDQNAIPVSSFRPWVEHGNRPMCWLGVRLKTESDKNACELTRVLQDSIDSKRVQSTPSIVAPTPSSNWKEKKGEESKLSVYSKVGLKPTLDGIDCSHTLACCACGDDISEGHGRYGENLCTDCGSKLSITRAAAKSLPQGFTLKELLAALAGKGGRPPREEHLPGMLIHLGYLEEDERWWPGGPTGPADQTECVPVGATGGCGP
jgi:P4 family phage/plasmid primase-like protien